MPDVFHAVADPTRRSILERLRTSGPLSLSALSAPLTISRQAVSKHLRVLEGAGLVESEARGRERIHQLQSEPLEQVDAWLAPYAADWDERLDRLRIHLGENPK